jgi:hypothetical protein
MNAPHDYRKYIKTVQKTKNTRILGITPLPDPSARPPCQTQLPLHPFVFFDYLFLVGSSNHARLKRLRSDNLAKNNLGLPTTLDPSALVLAVISDPTVLGLVTMPDPRFLGLAWLPDSTCLGLTPTLNPSYLGNTSTRSGARVNVLVNC